LREKASIQENRPFDNQPAPVDSGISFFRTDLQAHIPVTPMGVTNTARGTTLTGEKSASVHTVEHLLSAIHGFI